MSKVFIYNGQGTSEQSVADLQTLLSTDAIFGERPDIAVSTFNENFAGLEKPTLVVPAGTAYEIGLALKPIFKRIHSSGTARSYNYLGVCAGAFIASHDVHTKAEIFNTVNWLEKRTMIPTYSDLSNTPINCNIIFDYAAMGPFHPVNVCLNKVTVTYVPYRVNLQLGNTTLPQLYVGGPAFKQTEDSINVAQTLNVIANYVEGAPYKFLYPGSREKTVEYSCMPAIISARDDGYFKGARFLSGTHIEASVYQSKFLGLFAQPTDVSSALSASDMQAFKDEQEATNKTVINLLANTFKPR